MKTFDRIVALAQNQLAAYPNAPFSPGERYPEYPFDDISNSPNVVYRLVRQCLARLGLDVDRFGTPHWNPLGTLIKPGNRVVIKPNWVMHQNLGPGTLQSVVTHPSVVRAILDYVYIALGREGEIVIGDAPLQGCGFEKLLDTFDWPAIPQFYDRHSKLSVKLEDWRLETLVRDSPLTYHKTIRNADDSHILVDIKKDSSLEPVSHDFENFRVTNYDKRILHRHHQPGIHQYFPSRRILEADVIINVPKLKTHRKAGISCCMKNLVGINGHKSYLPHHRRGSADLGHDEYPSRSYLKEFASFLADWHSVTKNPVLQGGARLLYEIPRRLCQLTGNGILEGSWYGNDTLWRTIIDLNRIAMFADVEGHMSPLLKRNIFCLVDAIVAGEDDGPLKCMDRNIGVIIAGPSPVAVDCLATRLMGITYRRLPHISNSFGIEKLPLFSSKFDDIAVVEQGIQRLTNWTSPIRPFSLPWSWQKVSES
ncbi:MAG: DUF362 domain-containing protein [Deltaproteobacteria bacterium]|nr:DUF362 domain-containing protein [Deltaproteobacteria bacterium]